MKGDLSSRRVESSERRRPTPQAGLSSAAASTDSHSPGSCRGRAHVRSYRAPGAVTAQSNRPSRADGIQPGGGNAYTLPVARLAIRTRQPAPRCRLGDEVPSGSFRRTTGLIESGVSERGVIAGQGRLVPIRDTSAASWRSSTSRRRAAGDTVGETSKRRTDTHGNASSNTRTLGGPGRFRFDLAIFTRPDRTAFANRTQRPRALFRRTMLGNRIQHRTGQSTSSRSRRRRNAEADHAPHASYLLVGRGGKYLVYTAA